MTARVITLLGVILAVVGISAPTIDGIKLIAAAAIPVLIGVWQWQHHATIRNADRQAAAIRTAQANAGSTVDGLAAVLKSTNARVAALEAAAQVHAPQEAADGTRT